MIRMKALKSFGIEGSNEGPVRRGREFDAANEHRARDLESHGLAFRVKTEPDPKNKMEPTLKNKAAEKGPLAPAGGKTGAVSAQRSLPQAQRPKPPQSNS